jgi:hypothetical protein
MSPTVAGLYLHPLKGLTAAILPTCFQELRPIVKAGSSNLTIQARL